jgi:trans-aconitate 2-methyltransferase
VTQAGAGDGSSEWDAVTYDRVADPQARWGATVLARLPLAGDETVLDAGCGSGRVTEQLLSRLPRGHVVALDASARMLVEARRRLAGAGTRVSVVNADLVTLTPAQLDGRAPVDAVFSTATFHWVTDHPRLFANLAEVIRPGGRLVAQCGGEGNIARLIDVVRALGLERAGTWEYASVDTTARRLADAGFADVDVWLNEEPTPFHSTAHFHDFLESVCLRESLATMPEEDRESFLHAVVDALPDRTLDYVRLNIVARRV